MQSTYRAMLEAKLTERSTRDPETGCLRWGGTLTPLGYGKVSVHGRARSVHRVAHEIWIGPIPEEYDVDHVWDRGCRYRNCVEPSHLEAVTHGENVRRQHAKKTHCPQGHEYAGDNLKIENRRGYRTRTCLICHRASQRAASRRPKPCDVCGAVVSSGNLTKHVETQHLGIFKDKRPSRTYRRTVTCDFCGKSMANTNRARHIQLMHSESNGDI